MLHLMGAIQNCKEQGGIFLYFGVPPPLPLPRRPFRCDPHAHQSMP